MSKNIPFSLLLISLFLFNYQVCQNLDNDMMKALACISLIKKIDSNNLDQSQLSGIILTCFYNIDDSTVKKLLTSQFSKELNLEKKTIEKLTDFQAFQAKHSESEIMELSKKSNSALEKLRNLQNGKMPSSDDEERSKESKNKEKDVFLSNIMGLFNPNNSFIFFVGYLLLAYFLLKGFRKLLNRKSKTNKKNVKKD